MILWICPNGSMGLQIFVSADPAEGNAQAYDFSKNGADIPRPTMRNSFVLVQWQQWFAAQLERDIARGSAPSGTAGKWLAL